MEKKKREVKPTVETKLSREDFKRVDDLAKEDGVSKSELVRQAILWYLANTGPDIFLVKTYAKVFDNLRMAIFTTLSYLAGAQ